MGVRLSEGVYRRKKSRVFHKDLLSFLQMVAKNDRRSQERVCYRASDEIGKLYMENRESKDLKLAYLLCYLLASYLPGKFP